MSFNDLYSDRAGLLRDIEELQAKSDRKNEERKPFIEVPVGNYEASLMTFMLKPSKAGLPMASARFKIIAGEYAGQSVFYNQVLTEGFHFKNLNDFLESFQSGVKIDYVRNKEVDMDMLEEVLKEICLVVTYDFEIDYSIRNNYKIVKIVKTF